MHVCMQAQGHMLRPDSVLGVFLSQPSPYILEFLTDPEAHQFVKDGSMPRDPPISTFLVLGLQLCTTMPSFVCVCGGVVSEGTFWELVLSFLYVSPGD